MKREHDRETRVLKANKKATKTVQMEIWRERLESVDLIMKCLHSYNFTSGLDEADFLVFCFDRWRKKIHREVYGRAPRIGAEGVGDGWDSISNEELIRLAAAQAGAGESEELSAEDTATDDEEEEGAAGSKQKKASPKKRQKGKSRKQKKHRGAHESNRMITSTNPYYADSLWMEAYRVKKKQLDEKLSHVRQTQIAEMKQRDNALLHPPAADASPPKQERASPMSSKQTSRANSRRNSCAVDGTVSKRSPLKSTLSSNSIFSGISGGGSTLLTDKAAEHPIDADEAFLKAQEHTRRLKEAARDSKHKRDMMRTNQHQCHQKLVIQRRRRHPRDVDEENMELAKARYRAAGLKLHIRKGVDDDFAYLAPTLIPVPAAFDGDGHPGVSHTANNILFEVKKSMILSDLGYTPQQMLPLYVRNTLIEVNGTTPGGDQTYDTMAKDRRYTHYLGRPVNCFEPERILDGSLKSTHGSVATGDAAMSTVRTWIETESLPSIPSKHIRVQHGHSPAKQVEVERKAMRATRRLIKEEMDKAKKLNIPISKSLVRLAFNPVPDLSDLHYLDER